MAEASSGNDIGNVVQVPSPPLNSSTEFQPLVIRYSCTFFCTENAMYMIRHAIPSTTKSSLNLGDFGQRGDFIQFSISLYCLSIMNFWMKYFLLWSSDTNLYDEYLFVKFFVQRQYRDVEELPKVTLLFKVAPVDGIWYRPRSCFTNSFYNHDNIIDLFSPQNWGRSVQENNQRRVAPREFLKTIFVVYLSIG